MDNLLKEKLIDIAREKMKEHDPSHDISHSLRVLFLAEKIAINENSDLDIIIPAAIFHDVINYPKNHEKRLHSSKESAEFIKNILENLKDFPKNKIEKVYESIKLCSFSKGLIPDFIEAKILQDADGLESMGAISVMRTFASAGTLKRKFT